jgi:replicative DNA helicase
VSGNLPPPYDALAERALVAAVLSSPECLLDVLDVMRPDDAYGRPEREFLRLAACLHSEGIEFGPHALMRASRDQGMAEIVSSSWLASMLNEPVPASAQACARLVQARARQRRSLKVLRALTAAGEQPDIDVDAWLADIERQVYETGVEGDLKPVVTLRETLAEVATIVSERGRGHVDYVPTSLWALNRIILGWAVGKLQIIAGDPGDGKTSLALQEARNAAERGYAAVVFSYEMTRTELVEVMIGQVSGLSSDTLQLGQLNEAQWRDCAEAQAKLEPLPIAILDDSRIQLAELRSKARREYAKLQREHGGKLKGLMIVVDYIQLMPGAGEDYERISVNSTGLAVLAKDLNATVLVTSQFNRENKAGQSGKRRRPSIRDLKGSGSLEQDAHKIVLLYNENAHLDRDEQPPERRGIVAKNRGGKTGDAVIDFDGARRRFIDKKHESHDWIDDFHEGLP